MITDCYLPIWCQSVLDDGRTVNALVFIMDPCHLPFESGIRTQAIAPFAVTASGPLDTDARYLFSLEQELVKLRIQGDCLNDLVTTVEQLSEENLPKDVMRLGFA